MAKTQKFKNLPVLANLTGAKVIGLDAAGNDAQMNLDAIVRPENNFITAASSPVARTRFAGETYYVEKSAYGTALPNFGGVTVPVEDSGKVVFDGRVVWNNGAWQAKWVLADKPGIGSGTVTSENLANKAVSKDKIAEGAVSLGKTDFAAGGKNILDKSLLLLGYTINTGGNREVFSNSAIFAEIPCLPNTTYTFSGSVEYLNIRLRFLNASKVKVGFLPTPSAKPVTFTTPADCFFLDAVAYQGNSTVATQQLYINSAQIELGSVATTYEPFGYKIPTAIIDLSLYQPITLADSKYVQANYTGKNLFNKTSLIEGKGLDVNFNIVTLPSWTISQPIAVLPNTQYTFSGNITNIDARFRFETIDFVKCAPVGGVAATTVALRTFTTPSDCYWVYLPVTSSQNATTKAYYLNSAQLELGPVATAYEAYSKTINPSLIPPIDVKPPFLKGGKGRFLGDSMTAADQYQKVIQTSLGITYVNSGVGGSCVTGGTSNAAGDGTSRLPLVDRWSDLITDSPNFAFIWGGANDWLYRSQCPIGTIDSTDRNTFIGAYKEIILGFQAAGIQVFASTLLMRDNQRSNYATQKAYADATVAVCALYGVPVFNLFEKSGVNYENITQWTTDRTHPNTTIGYPHIGRLFANFINTYY